MQNTNEFFDSYPKNQGIFDFDKLKARPLYEIIPYETELEFYRLATTISLKKYQLMDDLARRLNLTLLARGTSRSVYVVNYDSTIVVKIGYDKESITDSAREFENQQFIKPFCTKCFEIIPTGTIGLFERVTPVMHFGKFKSMAHDIDILHKRVFDKYIMADIGMHNYMNYGFREGFGAVLLDYPYLYELDKSKLKCRNIIGSAGKICGGIIDYDNDFEHLLCNRCGKKYSVHDIVKNYVTISKRLKNAGNLKETINLAD